MAGEFAEVAAAFFAEVAPLSSLRPRLEAASGFDPEAWRRFCDELDGARLLLPAEEGGLAAGLVAASYVAEEAGRVLYGGPYLPAWLAGLLLTGLDTEQLAGIADGGSVAALALDASSVRAEQADGGWLLTASTCSVEFLDRCDLLLVVAETGPGAGLFVLEPDGPGVERAPAENLDLTRRTGLLSLHRAFARRLDVARGDVPGVDMLARARRAQQVAVVLRSAESLGSARRIHEITVDYARVREQFGRVIGSFQAVKHQLADLLVELEAATATVAEAVRLVATEPEVEANEVAVLTAGLVVDDTFARVTHAGIQLHGGIGFTWEHDAHLFYRRAAATRGVYGGRSARLGRLLEVGRRVIRSESGQGPPDAPPSDPELASFRERARRWLHGAIDRAEAPQLRAGPPSTTVEGLAAAKRHQQALQIAGFSGITYPRQYGGAGLTAEHEDAFFEETRSTGAGEDKIFRIGIGMIGPALLALGTATQRSRYLPPLLRGEEVWCELFSEPDSGSDMAGARTRAVRDGEEFVVTGQKVWTSNGHLCDFGLLLARTDPTAPKHHGLSMLVVPMTAPGVEVRPLRQMTGESDFNEVFLDGVRLPATSLVGGLHEGWQVARLVLQHERLAMGTSAVRRVSVEDLLELAGRAEHRHDPLVRARLAEQLLDERRLRSYFEYLAVPEHRRPLARESGGIAKLLMTGTMQRAAALGVELLGVESAAWAEDSPTGDLLHRVLAAQAFSIAGGTDNILRNLIGERALGLPRD